MSSTERANETQERSLRLVEATASAHRELLGAVRALEVLTEAEVSPALGDVERRITDLANVFVEHMRQEEASDLFSWLPERFPDMRRDVERLREEHRVLLASIRELADATRRVPEFDLTSPFSVRIRALIAAIRRHEAEESSLARWAVDES